MDDLPDVPFEKVLAYLDLKEVLRARAVSKGFYLRIDNYKVRSLFISDWESGYIEDKRRLVVGEFAQNSISTLRFESFFAIFRQMLSGLRRLRVCDLDVESKTSEFIRIVNSFQLEALDLVRISNLCGDFKLVLPKLKSIRLEDLKDFSAFWTLDAPRLSEMHVLNCYVGLNVIHPESVQTLEISYDDFLALKNFENLKILHCQDLYGISDSFLSDLEHLTEIHFDSARLEELHDQKHRYGRNELKLYYRGVCFANPRAHPRSITWNLCSETLSFMAANYSLLADRIPLYNTYYVTYSCIESAVPQMPIDFWRRLVHLRDIEISDPVKNVEQFLIFLRNSPVRKLRLKHADQPPGLLDQLPACCSPEFFSIDNDRTLDVSFLFEFKDLNELSLDYANFGLVQKLLKRQKFLRAFWFTSTKLHFKTSFFISVEKSKQLRLFKHSIEVETFTDLDRLIDSLSKLMS